MMTRTAAALALLIASTPVLGDTSPRSGYPDVRKFKEVGKFLPARSIWLVVGGGKHVLAKNGNDVVVYDAASGREAGTLKGTANIHDAGYSRDGRFLALAGYDSTVKVFDLSSMKEVASIGAHAGYS